VGGLDYAALEPSCRSLYIASGKPFQFDSDSENAVEKKEPEESKVRGTVNSILLLIMQSIINNFTIVVVCDHFIFILIILTVFVPKVNMLIYLKLSYVSLNFRFI
jgi:hypothetical protein